MFKAFLCSYIGPMTQAIGELTDRMRDIFGLVVEAYLERGLPVGSKALAELAVVRLIG